jgi:hemerythrin superfamily protein
MRDERRSTLNREHRMKATELLQKQHRDIEQLLERLKASAPGDDRTVREDLAKLLVAHTGIEEEIFYPAVQEAAPELTLEAIEEHGLIDHELGRLLTAKAEGDARSARIGVLAEVVLLHIRREENDLFRTAERALGGEVLAGLGAEMEPRFRELSAASYVRPLDRSIARNTPHLVAPRATAKKTARRAAPKKAAPKAKRGAPTQRAAAGARKGSATASASTSGAATRKTNRAGAGSRARAAG